MNFSSNPRLMTRALVLGLDLALAASGASAVTTCAAPVGYPSFCSIPAVPHDVRTAEAFKSVVVDTRLGGRSLEQNTGPNQFSLSDTAGFEAQAKLEATPPAPITTPGPADTEAFLRDARARVTPPPRPR